eukprot:m.63830 g.63830  ORF g.63830 m.63830 type:complete len:608 (-) comp7484_c0_seq1:48-1871(-)
MAEEQPVVDTAAEATPEAALAEQGDAEEAPPEPMEPLELPVLVILSEMQQEHGLRHADYRRYRQYCSRRLQRLRATLNFTSGKHRYTKRVVTVDKVTEARFLHIPMMLAERAWAYALELKQEVDERPRCKFSSMGRLRKAAVHAHQLYDLVHPSDEDGTSICTARGQLEVSAFTAWMDATVAFELQDWEVAMKKFGEAKLIYENLSNICADSERGLYEQKTEEIDANLRYCAYNIQGAGGDISQLLEIKSHMAKSGTLDLLSEKIERAMAESRERSADTLTEITWRGTTVPVRADRVRIAILTVRANEYEIDHNEYASPAARMEAFDKLFIVYNEAIEAVEKEIKQESSAVQSQKVEMNLGYLKFVEDYLTFLRLERTLERNSFMIEATKEQAEETSTDNHAGRALQLVQLYGTMVTNLQLMGDIPTLQKDQDFTNLCIAKQLYYKAHRCYHIAESLAQQGKTNESLAMNDHACSHVLRSKSHFAQCSDQDAKLAADMTAELDALLANLRGKKCAAQAARFLAETGYEEDKEQAVIEPVDPSSLDRLAATATEGSDALEFQTLLCKPLFFDLADNHIEFPSLEHRLPSGGAVGAVTGMIKNLWGWRS